MSFHEVRFPEHISYGSVGGPGFQTSVLTSGTGKEQRNAQWSTSRAEYDAKYAIRSVDDMYEVIKFFYARRGMLYGFRYKDWADFEIEEQNIGVFDGSTRDFQLFKRYSDGGSVYDRKITKPVEGSLLGLRVGSSLANEDNYTLDYTTGIVRYTGGLTTGAVISILGIEFDVPARFDFDKLPVSYDGFDEQSIESIPIVEIQQ